MLGHTAYRRIVQNFENSKSVNLVQARLHALLPPLLHREHTITRKQTLADVSSVCRRMASAGRSTSNGKCKVELMKVIGPASCSSAGSGGLIWDVFHQRDLTKQGRYKWLDLLEAFKFLKWHLLGLCRWDCNQWRLEGSVQSCALDEGQGRKD